MNITRRSFIGFTLSSLFGSKGLPLLAQGIASRGVKAQARPKPVRAVLLMHVLSMSQNKPGCMHPQFMAVVSTPKKYILEANGCGCAFFDYDNDGWMDIFLLCGTRLEDPPSQATNRLYKNNRDGTFTVVSDKAGLQALGWGNGVCIGDYNNDGFEDIFCTYFWAEPAFTVTMETVRSPM